MSNLVIAVFMVTELIVTIRREWLGAILHLMAPRSAKYVPAIALCIVLGCSGYVATPEQAPMDSTSV